ncbi:hypothetical protein B0H17DRAFT_689133 [Mycena rosella]|uniref:DRBM domain-containing protein n=1 Tax=Mycena rosella TaxID=1033263 RepID=A0AAD7DB44_MYCRO|nr:hypothetical protein B0H17DRAFT_689133 [Mycena rosella]
MYCFSYKIHCWIYSWLHSSALCTSIPSHSLMISMQPPRGAFLYHTLPAFTDRCRGFVADHPRTDLNNIAVRRGQRVEYVDSCTGPLDNPQWTSVVFLNRIEYGRGYSRTKGGARERAARAALGLIAQGY